VLDGVEKLKHVVSCRFLRALDGVVGVAGVFLAAGQIGFFWSCARAGRQAPHTSIKKIRLKI